MKLFIYLLLQILVFMPVAGLAAESGKTPPIQNHQKTEVTEARKAGVVKTYGKLPLYFIENKGQVDGQVSFYERGAGHATFFTKDGVVLSLTKSEGKAGKDLLHGDIKGLATKAREKVTTEAVRLSFVGANEKVKITAEDKMPGRVNYFVGNDKSKWRSNIPTYGAVTYKDVYKNIDIKFYGNNKNIEHDVIVRPGGDPSLVEFAYKGIKGLKVTDNGDLEVSLTHGKIIEKRPVIYQDIKGERVAVDGAYRILQGRDGTFAFGFKVATYDRKKDLVIDPVLVYSTYLGGSDFDSCNAVTIDATGAAYMTGTTRSIDFPLTTPIQGAIGGSKDIYITKINPTGTAIVYSTYLGGSGDDIGWDLILDSTGAMYVTGQTLSTNFPLVNPIQTTNGGVTDTFITKLNPAGSSIIYSTYLGGNSDDVGQGLDVDNTGAVFVTGYTFSSNFPIVNPVQGFLNGPEDIFITKIHPSGSAIAYSTYLGGSSNDAPVRIAIDGTGAAYVTGLTLSMDFPIVNPIQGTFGGGTQDAFITKVNSTGSAISWSTYLGGAGDDRGQGITLDNTGAIYVTGFTFSSNFPIVNPIQSILKGSGDVFITKIHPTGTTIAYSTYLGGAGNDAAVGIAIDSSGSTYITGNTSSTDFPIVNPIQGAYGGGIQDAFITKVNPAGTTIAYSTYLGGTGNDGAKDIVVDSAGAVYVAGFTTSTDLPLVSPIQGAYGGGAFDAFITKISLAPLPVVTLTITPDVTSIARGSTLGYSVTATNTTTTTQCFNYWEDATLPNGSTYPPTGALFGPVHLCLNAGASKTAHLTHGVPMSAPVGAYTINAFTGAYPAIIVSEAHFNFNVTAFNPATNHPATSWRLIENGFRK